MVHTLGGLGHPEITRGSLIPTLWVSHRSFGDMGGEIEIFQFFRTLLTEMSVKNLTKMFEGKQ